LTAENVQNLHFYNKYTKCAPFAEIIVLHLWP